MEINSRFPAIQNLQTSEAAVAAESDSPAGEQQEIQQTAGLGFFISPLLQFDAPSSTVIFQVRDPESGDVRRQFPAETVVEQYRRDPSSRPFTLSEPTTPSESTEPDPDNTQEPRVVQSGSDDDQAVADQTGTTAPGNAVTGLSNQAVSPQLAPSPGISLIA